jgi:hypothetical protein
MERQVCQLRIVSAEGFTTTDCVLFVSLPDPMAGHWLRRFRKMRSTVPDHNRKRSNMVANVITDRIVSPASDPLISSLDSILTKHKVSRIL